MTKILMVTQDLKGPVVNGGIGTAFEALVQRFHEKGFDIDILWVPGKWVEPRQVPNERKDELTILYWMKYYKEQGANLIPLPEPPPGDYAQEPWRFAISHHIYKWCKDKEYDFIIVHEWTGIGGHLAAGRKQGKVKSPVITWMHSPTLWHTEMNGVTTDPSLLHLDALECMAIRWADAVVSPSVYLLDWARQRGITNDRSYVVRNYPTDTMLERAKPYEKGEAINHVVFFGRQEYRKGLHLFTGAIKKILEDWEVDVTILGKESQINGESSIQWIKDELIDVQYPYRIEPNKSQEEALELIDQPGTLVVMPSLVENYPYTVYEAMIMGIPLITCATGGIPELVKTEAMMCEPTAQSVHDRIEMWLDDYDLVMDQVIREVGEMDHNKTDAWTWEEVFKSVSRKPLPIGTDELVSIIIPTYNRPILLERALRSCVNQSYENIEVVVVDDCSKDENSVLNKEIVDKVSDETNTKGKYIYLLKEKNEYLGAARQTGVEAASGEYVVYLDDDNILKPRAIEEMIYAMKASGADCVVSPLDIFQEIPENRVTLFSFTGELSAGFYDNKIGEACHMINRDVPLIIPWTTERTGHEDWEYLSRIALRGWRIFPLADPVVLYSQDPEGMLQSGDPIADNKRSMRPWYEEPIPAYPLKNFLEIAQVQSRMVGYYDRELRKAMQAVQELQNKIKEYENPEPRRATVPGVQKRLKARRRR